MGFALGTETFEVQHVICDGVVVPVLDSLLQFLCYAFIKSDHFVASFADNEVTLSLFCNEEIADSRE
jgi:hypothetical protein